MTKTGYHGLKTKSETESWTDIQATISEEEVVIDGHPVMEKWEQPYMAKLAELATSEGGIVLEVGFGLGLSGRAVQKHNIKEHILIEGNRDVFTKLVEFAQDEAREGRPRVTPLFGMWEDIVRTIPTNSVDGILYDTYPQNKEEQHTHQFKFIREAARILKPGGVLTYCNLTSLGVLGGQYRVDDDDRNWAPLYKETQKPYVESAGFEMERYDLFPVNAPKECEYYQLKKAFCPVLRKKPNSRM